MNERTATMKDVAKRAEVSLSTVSYVLNDNGPVSPERRQRVLEAVAFLDYTPNDAGRLLRRRAVAPIGMVVPELSNPFFGSVVEGVERAASMRDSLLVLCTPESRGGSNSAHSVDRLLRRQRLSGVVYIAGSSTRPEFVTSLTGRSPLVLVDERLPGVDLHAVVSDNRGGAREVAAHVVARGHRRIAVIGGPGQLWSAQERLLGYQDAFRAAAIDVSTVPVVEGDYREQSGHVLARRLLDVTEERRPTALICANDLMAIGAMDYARSVGLRIPTDVSVVGYDDLPFTRSLTPSLTTVRQLAYDLGKTAGELLFDLIHDSPGAATGPVPEPEPLKTELQVRDSVARPSH